MLDWVGDGGIARLVVTAKKGQEGMVVYVKATFEKRRNAILVIGSLAWTPTVLIVLYCNLTSPKVTQQEFNSSRSQPFVQYRPAIVHEMRQDR